VRIGSFCIIAVLAAACILFGSSESSAQTRIRFARGRTSASISGTLASGGIRRYVLWASSGQHLSGNLSSKNGCVKFTEGSTGIGFTTQSGDNRISITNYCRSNTSFVMTVSINY